MTEVVDEFRSPLNRARAQALRGHRVWQHRRWGGVYTVVGREDGEIYYVSHADGRRWHRPETEFFDGRFAPSSEPALAPDEAGFVRG